MAQRSTLEVQTFFRQFGDIRLALLLSQKFDSFVTKLEKDGKKPGSILFYIRSLMKFLEFLMSNNCRQEDQFTKIIGKHSKFPCQERGNLSKSRRIYSSGRGRDRN